MNIYTIDDVADKTGRSRETIHYHVKTLGLGTVKGGVIFLAEREVKRICARIDARRPQYDAAVATRRAHAKRKTNRE